MMDRILPAVFVVYERRELIRLGLGRIWSNLVELGVYFDPSWLPDLATILFIARLALVLSGYISSADWCL